MEENSIIGQSTFRPGLVSVVIPTRNGRRDLESLLPRLLAQKTDFPFEVTCIDSESTDGTWDLLARFPVKRHRIAKEQFSHGGTRNLGISLTSGEIIVLMTQDAIPVDDRLLANLVSNYADPAVGGVYARQLPRPEGALLPKIDLSISQNGKPERAVSRIQDHPDYHSLPPLRRRELCNFDNICSSMRRETWKKTPLPERGFAEDLDWGKQVFEGGWTIVYEPKAAVLHSHDRSFWYEVKRSFVTYDVIREFFGYRHTFRAAQLLATMKGLRGSLRRGFPELMRASSRRARLRAYWIILARLLGQWFYSTWQELALDRNIAGACTMKRLFYSGV